MEMSIKNVIDQLIAAADKMRKAQCAADRSLFQAALKRYAHDCEWEFDTRLRALKKLIEHKEASMLAPKPKTFGVAKERAPTRYIVDNRTYEDNEEVPF
jgi:hypothetical protein